MFLGVVVVARSTVIHYDYGSATPVVIFRVTGPCWYYLLVTNYNNLSLEESGVGSNVPSPKGRPIRELHGNGLHRRAARVQSCPDCVESSSEEHLPVCRTYE